jgi:hypothetical protein
VGGWRRRRQEEEEEEQEEEQEDEVDSEGWLLLAWLLAYGRICGLARNIIIYRTLRESKEIPYGTARKGKQYPDRPARNEE